MTELRLSKIAVWFPAIRTGTGTDIFTERLVGHLNDIGIRAEVHWLPHRAEFAPWTVVAPEPPNWATVVHVNSWLPRKFVPINLPVVCTVHSVVHAPELRRFKTQAQSIYHRFWIHRSERISIQSSVEVTAVSQYVADQVQVEFGRRAKVVLNWIDTNQFSPPLQPRPQANKRFRVLYAGTARMLKGVDMLPALAEELGSDFELVATISDEQMRRLGLDSDNVRCIGRLNEVRLREMYGSSDVLLFPSRAEGFGLVALEAQACGLPVVATRGTAIPEVVEDGRTGVLCPPDDVIFFANAIRKLRENPGLLQSMRIAARKRALAEFDKTVALERYCETYASAMRTDMSL